MIEGRKIDDRELEMISGAGGVDIDRTHKTRDKLNKARPEPNPFPGPVDSDPAPEVPPGGSVGPLG